MPIHTVGRRTFLRGLGAALALPFLPSALPRRAWADEGAPPTRLLYVYTPNGWDMDRFRPSGEGRGFTWSPILAGLERHREDVLVLSGLDNRPGNRRPGDAGAGAHFQQTASFLTCTHVDKTPVSVGRSIDQVAADQLGFVTPFRSLVLGMTGGATSGACGGNDWPCSYLSNISWADARTPLAKQTSPEGLFDRLFGGGVLGGSEAAFARRKAERLRVLDVVARDAMDLERRLGAYDRQKLQQYLTAVEETEAKVEARTFGLTCDPGDDGYGASGYLDQLEAMLDVLVLAYACDMTRIATFMTWNGGASHGVPYDWVDYEGTPIAETFHTLSHHGGDPVKLGKIAAINQWEVDVFAGLLDRLVTTPAEDGSRLLDHSIVLFSSEVSDGDSHSANDLGIVVAGRGGGRLETGQHRVYRSPDNVYADLHIALLEAFGTPVSGFGEDGTGVLPGVVR